MSVSASEKKKKKRERERERDLRSENSFVARTNLKIRQRASDWIS